MIILSMPCKDCISFPICNSEFMTAEESFVVDENIVYMIYQSKCKFISYIWGKCEIAKEFISQYEPIYSEHGSWLIYEYFRGYNMKKGNI